MNPTKNSTEKDNLEEDSLLPKNRIEALCDGIFTIAMTLLILNLNSPDNMPNISSLEEIPGVLFNLIPDFESYALSFFVLAIFWLRHQIHFKYLKFADRKIVFLNVLFLLFIVCVPFSVGFMMKYEHSRLALIVYIVNLMMISGILTIHFLYISFNKKIQSEEITPILMKEFFIVAVIPISIFTLSFVFSFINLRISFLLIYLDPISFAFYRILIKKFIIKNN